MKTFITIILSILISVPSFAQDSDCNVKNKVHADGTLYYYLEPDTLYYTNSKQLLGNISTDKENYFISLYPLPAPSQAGSIKNYKPLEITLENGSVYNLECYDARVLDDSVFVIMYLFDEKENAEIFEHGVNQLILTSPEGTQTYILKLHKEQLLRSFNCLKGNIRKI